MNKESPLSEKPDKSFNFSLIAGTLILINAVLLGIVANWFIGIMPTLPGSSGNDPRLLLGLAIFGSVLGLIILLCALMLHMKSTNKKALGIMIIVFSLLSVIMGGGFIVGFIMGIIGGRIALSRLDKPA